MLKKGLISFIVFISIFVYFGMNSGNDTLIHAETQSQVVSRLVEIFGDLNGDNIINEADVKELAKIYNSVKGDAGYSTKYDLNNDGIIDLYDMVQVAREIGTETYRVYSGENLVDVFKTLEEAQQIAKTLDYGMIRDAENEVVWTNKYVVYQTDDSTQNKTMIEEYNTLSEAKTKGNSLKNTHITNGLDEEIWTNGYLVYQGTTILARYTELDSAMAEAKLYPKGYVLDSNGKRVWYGQYEVKYEGKLLPEGRIKNRNNAILYAVDYPNVQVVNVDDQTDIWEQAKVQLGHNRTTKAITIYSSNNKTSGDLGVLKPNEGVVIIDSKDQNFYQVKYNHKYGYIEKTAGLTLNGDGYLVYQGLVLKAVYEDETVAKKKAKDLQDGSVVKIQGGTSRTELWYGQYEVYQDGNLLPEGRIKNRNNAILYAVDYPNVKVVNVDDQTDIWKQAKVQLGHNRTNKAITIYSSNNKTSGDLGVLKPNEGVVIIDSKDQNFYQVKYNHQYGYIEKTAGLTLNGNGYLVYKGLVLKAVYADETVAKKKAKDFQNGSVVQIVGGTSRTELWRGRYEVRQNGNVLPEGRIYSFDNAKLYAVDYPNVQIIKIDDHTEVWKQAKVQLGHNQTNKAITIYSSNNKTSGDLGVLKPNEGVVIIDSKDQNFYQVKYNHKYGYIEKTAGLTLNGNGYLVYQGLVLKAVYEDETVAKKKAKDFQNGSVVKIVGGTSRTDLWHGRYEVHQNGKLLPGARIHSLTNALLFAVDYLNVQIIDVTKEDNQVVWKQDKLNFGYNEKKSINIYKTASTEDVIRTLDKDKKEGILIINSTTDEKWYRVKYTDYTDKSGSKLGYVKKDDVLKTSDVGYFTYYGEKLMGIYQDSIDARTKAKEYKNGYVLDASRKEVWRGRYEVHQNGKLLPGARIHSFDNALLFAVDYPNVEIIDLQDGGKNVWSQKEITYGYPTVDALHVREKADSNSTSLGKIGYGDVVKIIDDSKTWYKVKYNNQVGYVHGDYISKSPNSNDLASKVGKRLADFSKNVYKYPSPNSSQPGQCVWYVRGRAWEKGFSTYNIMGNGDEWVPKAKINGAYVSEDINGVRTDSILGYKTGKWGHVVYIEYVDESSKDRLVYFTEANYKEMPDGSVDVDHKLSDDDGILKVLKFTEFKKRIGSGFQGYIYLNDKLKNMKIVYSFDDNFNHIDSIRRNNPFNPVPVN